MLRHPWKLVCSYGLFHKKTHVRLGLRMVSILDYFQYIPLVTNSPVLETIHIELHTFIFALCFVIPCMLPLYAIYFASSNFVLLACYSFRIWSPDPGDLIQPAEQ